MSKIFCPFAQMECKKDECIFWGAFPAMNPQTGQIIPNKIIGEGCTWANKILKAPMPAKA